MENYSKVSDVEKEVYFRLVKILWNRILIVSNLKMKYNLK
jgi:hypothetical protein